MQKENISITIQELFIKLCCTHEEYVKDQIWRGTYRKKERYFSERLLMQ